MSLLKDKKIILGITAGIAAYKAAYLLRGLIKKGAEVQVVMTAKAQEFVTPLTLSTLSKKPVVIEFSDSLGNWNNHVDLGLWGDIMLIAPATANSLSKMAAGESDNFLITTYLSARCPVFVAPAMDLDMYQHETTKTNLEILKKHQVQIIPAEKGELASGLEGEGRMAEPETIIHHIETYLKKELSLAGKKILITAGPTYEPLDPVRFIGNHSSGKMGYDIAKEASKRGAEVILISGPSHETIENYNIQLHQVMTAQDMYNKVFQYYDDVDIAIMSAAVADYKPKHYSEIKIKKKEELLTLELEKNKDILKKMGEEKKKQILVGFALETHQEEENAKEKLHQKNLDAIILNSLNDKGAGFKKDTNKIQIITQTHTKEYPLKSKEEVSKDILDFIENLS